MLVLDDSLQIKINSSKYFGLKFAATGPSYQFNSDSFVRLLDEKNYTEWLVPKTGGTFTGTIRMKNDLIFGEGALTNNWGIGGLRWINLKNTSQTSDGERFLYTDPQVVDSSSNNNVIMTANGELWISGGEAANTVYQYMLNYVNKVEGYTTVENEGFYRTSENCYLLADGNLYFESNAKQGATSIVNRKCMIFNTAGNLIVPSNTTATRKVRNISYQNGGTVNSLANGDIVLVY